MERSTVTVKIKQEQPLCVFSLFCSSTLSHLSLPFHGVLAAFLELQWAGLSGYVFTCKPVLPILLLAGDPCPSDLFFHSCSGRKGDIMLGCSPHELRVQCMPHCDEIDPALKPRLCPISVPLLQCYNMFFFYT